MAEPMLDELFALLAHPYRRRIVRYLRDDGDESMSLDALVDHVASHDADVDADSIPDRQRVSAELHHVHLPKLSDRGPLEYDARSSTVRYSPSRRLDDVLDGLVDEPDLVIR